LRFGTEHGHHDGALRMGEESPMIGLLIRLLVLCSVVFAVVYGVTRALRVGAINRESKHVADEIRKLRLAIQREEMDPADYVVIAARIRKDCKRLGIDAPELPPHLPPRPPKD
jgi:hypothetical protein